MKLIHLFHFTLFAYFATSNLNAQSYMTLGDNPQVVSYTGAHLDLAIPTNPSPYNVLRFTLKGGDGGDRRVSYEVTSYRAKGGEGAVTTCEFRVGNGSALEPGGTLRFIVGEKGQGTNGIGTEGCGGGGGTGLLYLAPGLNATSADDWVILAVAGGGGGAYANGVGGKKDGKGGNDDPDGSGSNGHNASSSGSSDPHGTGGENGDGGLASDGGTSGGAGGGGYSGDGQVIGHASASNCTGTGGSKGGILGGDGGKDDFCVDGRDGGWGYGGGGSGEAAGGGGGGYSGGGGGTSGVTNASGGGGGGSYVEQTLAESFGLTEGGTTSDPQNGVIFYQFQTDGPTISSCNNFLISLNASGQVTIDATTILDEYYAPAGSTITSTQSNFDCDDIGGNIVTVTITDTEGNTATCNAGIEIEDNTAPTAVCTAATVYLGNNGEASLSPDAIDFASTDACGIDEKVLSDVDFDCNDVGNATVTLTVYDSSGNASSCSGAVTIEDNVAPTAICQNVTVQLDSNGDGATSANAVDNGSSDACGIAAKALNENPSFDCGDVGTHTFTLSVTDLHGNSNTCTAQVTVQDQVNPIAYCSDITAQLDQNGAVTIDENGIDNGSSDACGIDSKSLNITSFDCDDVGSNIVLLTVIDENNNSDFCTAVVVVEDQVMPTALCQDITIQLDPSGETTITTDDIDNGSSDACGIDSRSLNVTSYDCDDVGSNIVLLIVRDESNNSNYCTASVIVEDQVLPTVLCQDITVQLDANGAATITTDDIDDGSSDACGIEEIALDITSFDCDDVGENVVILDVFDANDNSSYCTATVTVQDQVIPMALCQNSTVQLDASGAATTTADAIDNGSSDACGIEYKLLNMTSFDCDDVGANVVQLVIVDANNNSSFCTAEVTVEDQVAPTANCQDVTIQLDNNGQSSTSANDIDDASSDACGIESLAITQTDFDCDNIGSNTVTMTVTDVNDNSSTCSATVTVQDNIAPVAVCQDITVDFNGEQSIGWTVDQLWDEGNSSDNCVEVFATGQSLSQATCAQLGSVLNVTVTIEDGSGNESNCNAKVAVDGLPCGWHSDAGGINCSGAETDYNTSTGEFSLTTQGCYDPSYYRYADAHGFIQTELCGDGEISAEITGLIGTGWAGISMRESNDPTAQMLQLMIDGNIMTRREVRMSPGGAAFAHQYQTSGNNWLKLSRSGNQFSAYQSQDGINWSTVFVTNIAMSNCIQIGLITMNGTSSGELTGLFENVLVTTLSTLSIPNIINNIQNGDIAHDFSLFPNPATDEVNIQLDALPQNGEVDIQIYNHYGQTVLERHLTTHQSAIIQLNLGKLPAGTYLVEVLSDGQRKTKKLVVSGF